MSIVKCSQAVQQYTKHIDTLKTSTTHRHTKNIISHHTNHIYTLNTSTLNTSTLITSTTHQHTQHINTQHTKHIDTPNTSTLNTPNTQPTQPTQPTQHIETSHKINTLGRHLHHIFQPSLPHIRSAVCAVKGRLQVVGYVARVECVRCVESVNALTGIYR